MTSAPVAANACPGRDEELRPPGPAGAGGSDPQTVSRTRTDVVPTATMRRPAAWARVDRRGRLLPHLVRLGVEGVVGQVVGGHRAERVDADRECHLGDLEARPHLVPHLGS